MSAFLAQIRRPARDEAYVAWLDGRRAAAAVSGPVVVVQIGAGSIRIAVGEGDVCWMTHALPLGPLRLRRAFLTPGAAMNEREAAAVARHVRETAAELVAAIQAMGPLSVVFSGGVPRLAAALAGEPLTPATLDALAARLVHAPGAPEAPPAYRALPGATAETLALGAIAMRVLLDLLGAREAAVAAAAMTDQT